MTQLIIWYHIGAKYYELMTCLNLENPQFWVAGIHGFFPVGAISNISIFKTISIPESPNQVDCRVEMDMFYLNDPV